MSEKNQILENIQKELENSVPSKRQILSYLLDLPNKKRFPSLSDSDIYFIIGETFKTNPNFFMDSLYADMRKGLQKKYKGILLEMDRNVIEQYCLYDGEEIRYQCEGNLKQQDVFEQSASGKLKMASAPITIKINSATIFITNYRLIAQGILKVSGGRKLNTWVWGGSLIWSLSGGSRREQSKRSFEAASPRYGYDFPIWNHTELTILLGGVRYALKIDNRTVVIVVKPSQSNKEQHLNSIFEILSQNADQAIDVLHEINVTEKHPKMRRKFILSILMQLRKSKEYQKITESEYLNIIEEAFRLDPSFFMSSIYPKLESWDHSSYTPVKEKVIALIGKLNSESTGDDSIKFIKE
ncbi:MAG: hypothetical protein ACW986_19715 [Promethearchaeota archaeon]